MERCPYCGEPIDFDGFDNLEEDGDVIVATAQVVCECGETLTVKAWYHWDGDYEIT